VSWFENLFEARRKIVAWRTEYNQERPHSSLGYRTPEEFAREMGGEKGRGKDGGFATLENATRFPLSHRHGGDGQSTSDAVSNSDVVV
jgi:putative transposase